jgi:hypothetical protein
MANVTITKLTAPNILLSGTQITDTKDTQTTVEVSLNQGTSIQNITSTFGAGTTEYKENNVLVFRDKVQVVMNSSYTAQAESAAVTAAAAALVAAGKEVNYGKFRDATNVNLAEIRYTLNGKDPSRTKFHIYRDSFYIKTNKSGSDNTILKARVYYQGQWSDVVTVELKIASVDNTTFHNERGTSRNS